TGLVVYEDTYPRHCGQFALDRVKLFAVVYGQPARPVSAFYVFPRLVGDNDHPARTLPRDLRGDLRNREPAILGPSARHRDGIIEQDLVGHRHAGRDRSADREIT